MIRPKFVVEEVGLDSKAVLIKDRTGNGALSPGTGYGGGNMARTDFSRYRFSVYRFDVDGTTVATVSQSGLPPEEYILKEDFEDGVYSLVAEIGARPDATASRVDAFTAAIPANIAPLSQLDKSFYAMSSEGAPINPYTVVTSIQGSAVTLLTSVANHFVNPVFWYQSTHVFVVSVKLEQKIAQLVMCGCGCSEDLTKAFCSYVRAKVLASQGLGHRAAAEFVYAKNLVASL